MVEAPGDQVTVGVGHDVGATEADLTVLPHTDAPALPERGGPALECGRARGPQPGGADAGGLVGDNAHGEPLVAVPAVEVDHAVLAMHLVQRHQAHEEVDGGVEVGGAQLDGREVSDVADPLHGGLAPHVPSRSASMTLAMCARMALSDSAGSRETMPAMIRSC